MRRRNVWAVPPALLLLVVTALGALAGSAGASSHAPVPTTGAAAPSENGRIVFTSNWAENLAAEIYRVDIATGRRVNLTRHAGYDNAAVVSPDGRTILFRSSRDNFAGLWRMNADGSGHRLFARGEFPAWSSDSSRVAFVEAGPGPNIATVAADGTDLQRVGRGTAPSWSPDGGSLAYLDNEGSIVVAAADGTGARVVFTSTRIVPAIEWSPHGNELAVSAEVLLESGGVLRSAVVVVPAAGGEPRVLTRGDDRDPDWSPDGRRIAFYPGNRIFTVAGGRRQRHPDRRRADGQLRRAAAVVAGRAVARVRTRACGERRSASSGSRRPPEAPPVASDARTPERNWHRATVSRGRRTAGRCSTRSGCWTTTATCGPSTPTAAGYGD